MEKQIDLQMETTRSGYPTLKVFYEEKEYYLHSKYNPIREAETWAKGFYEKGKLSILIGLGLGYYTKELLKIMDKEDRILVIEPCEKILNLAQEVGIKELLDDSRVFLCLDSDKMKLGPILRRLIHGHFFKRSKIFVAPNYDKIAAVDMVIQGLSKAFGDYTVDINTKLLLAYDWQKNYLRNMKYAIGSCPIKAFENRFSCPVIIVSAGPSLQNDLDKLEQLYSRAIIISAGSATPTLLKNGIKPHIIVSIDGHIDMFNHLKDIDYKEIPLFYAPTHNYKISEQHTGPKVIFQTSGMESVVNWYNEVIGFETGLVPVGPSVANFCLAIAYMMTSGPICFIGQDLGYVGGFSHAEGNNNRISKDNVELALYPVISNDGSELYTDYSLIVMREWFENYIYEYPRDNIYNASLHGAKIKGTHVVEFRKFIATFCQDDIDVKQRILDTVENWSRVNKSREVQTDKVFEELTVTIRKMVEITKQANTLSEKLLKKVKSRDDKGVNTLLGKLTDIDKKLLALKNKDGLLFLIIQLIVDILHLWDEEDEDDYIKRIKIAEKSCFFYRNLNTMSKTVGKMLNDIKLEGK